MALFGIQNGHIEHFVLVPLFSGFKRVAVLSDIHTSREIEVSNIPSYVRTLIGLEGQRT